MKHFISFLFSVLVFASIQAQTNTPNSVYLKNGSKINCLIIELIPEDKVKIETYDGSIFVYEMSEVERIDLNENVLTKENQGQTEKSSIKTKGYKFIGELGPVISANGGDALGGVRIVNGAQLGPIYYLGGAINLKFGDFFVATGGLNQQIYFLKESKVKPLFFLDLSYGYVFNAHGLDVASGFGVEGYVGKNNIGIRGTVGFNGLGEVSRQSRQSSVQISNFVPVIPIMLGITF